MDFNDLKRFPYFTRKEVKAFLKKKHPEVVLTRWKSKLIVIEKGKYTLHENPLIYATVMFTPSYLSFRSALSYYQLTNQIPLQAQVVVSKRKKDLSNISFFTTAHVFGYTKVQVDGFDVFIAEKEKLLLDCILYPNAGVSLDELSSLLTETLDVEKIVLYLKKIANVNLIKRVGYLLEKHGVDIYSNFVDVITKSSNYPLLYQKLPKKNMLNKKWKIHINGDVPA